jgi:predicted RNase H-like HicB family nuclease
LKQRIALDVEKLMQVSNTLELSAVVRREDRIYVALCPEFDVASQGKSVEEALRNLKQALELYMEDEDVEKPSKAEAPMVTIVKVDVSGSAHSLRAQSN